MSEKIRVMVVDDNSILRMGLAEAVGSEEDLEVVGEADNGSSAINCYRELTPDVVTMDYQMPGENGIEGTKKIIAEFPDAKIVLLSVFEGEEDIWNAVQAGAQGYLNKRGDIEEVLDAIREIAAGGTYFPAAMAEKLSTRESRESLTDREHQVLHLIVHGRSNKEIVEDLGISEGTVKLHVSRVLDKLRTADRTQAAIKAIRDGIVHFDD
ncbi:MAG: response regulator transcription factor [Verrucomicrobiota bacterium]